MVTVPRPGRPPLGWDRSHRKRAGDPIGRGPATAHLLSAGAAWEGHYPRAAPYWRAPHGNGRVSAARIDRPAHGSPDRGFKLTQGG